MIARLSFIKVSVLKSICVQTGTFIIQIKGSWQIFVNPLHLNIKIQLISCTTVSIGIMTARYIWIERSNTEVIKNKKFNISTTIFKPVFTFKNQIYFICGLNWTFTNNWISWMSPSRKQVVVSLGVHTLYVILPRGNNRS